MDGDRNKIIITKLKNRLNGVDEIIVKNNNTMRITRCFFFRMGQTSKTFATEVSSQMDKIKVDHSILSYFEVYKKWPNQSYFETNIKVKNINKLKKL